VDFISLPASLLEPTKDISDLPALTRRYVHKARMVLFEKHRAGAGGLEIAAAYSKMMDELICHLFAAISKDFQRRYPTGNPQCAIIAQGGYGRSELNPHSDIDLLFIYSWKVSAFVEAVTEKLLYTLWDAGLQVGHAIRSISESMRLASTDMKVRTALLDSRYACGDLALYNEFEKAVQSRLARKRVTGFVGEKLAENDTRHAGYGGSVYLLEPDVKESEGGLRDIHTARWMARVKMQVKDLDELVGKGIISAADIAKLKNSHDFLLRVRNELHFSTGKHQDQLTFEEQEKVSQALKAASRRWKYS
jgi:[protein-PII] uridylyltransferase